MSHSINWDLLEDQYLSDGMYREKLSKMVTIVDEAFLAGKKFARTFSTDIDNNTQKNAAQTKTEGSQTKQEQNQDKNVDVTYNEKSQETDSVNEAEQTEEPKVDPVLQTLNADLKRLLIEGKVNQALYDKLTSNARFELNAKDIEDINNLTEIKEVLTHRLGKYICCNCAVVLVCCYLSAFTFYGFWLGMLTIEVALPRGRRKTFVFRIVYHGFRT